MQSSFHIVIFNIYERYGLIKILGKTQKEKITSIKMFRKNSKGLLIRTSHIKISNNNHVLFYIYTQKHVRENVK